MFYKFCSFGRSVFERDPTLFFFFSFYIFASQPELKKYRRSEVYLSNCLERLRFKDVAVEQNLSP